MVQVDLGSGKHEQNCAYGKYVLPTDFRNFRLAFDGILSQKCPSRLARIFNFSYG